MKCPTCQAADSRVVDSRLSSDGYTIRRRRSCEKCESRFSTVEQLELLNIQVEKRSGTTESYSRDKVAIGLRRALQKRPFASEDFQSLVAAIERDIQRLKRDVVRSQEIGEIVMRHLRDLDEVAYIRFASVYRSFADLETFAAELQKLFPSRPSADLNVKKQKS